MAPRKGIAREAIVGGYTKVRRSACPFRPISSFIHYALFAVEVLDPRHFASYLLDLNLKRRHELLRPGE